MGGRESEKGTETPNFIESIRVSYVGSWEVFLLGIHMLHFICLPPVCPFAGGTAGSQESEARRHQCVARGAGYIYNSSMTAGFT